MIKNAKIAFFVMHDSDPTTDRIIFVNNEDNKGEMAVGEYSNCMEESL